MGSEVCTWESPQFHICSFFSHFWQLGNHSAFILLFLGSILEVRRQATEFCKESGLIQDNTDDNLLADDGLVNLTATEMCMDWSYYYYFNSRYAGSGHTSSESSLSCFISLSVSESECETSDEFDIAEDTAVRWVIAKVVSLSSTCHITKKISIAYNLLYLKHFQITFAT